MPMQPGSPQAQMPAREDALIRKIQEIERVQREMLPSVALSIKPAMDDIRAQQATLADQVAAIALLVGAQMSPAVGNASTGVTPFGTTTTPTNHAPVTITVPAGFTKAAVIGISAMTAFVVPHTCATLIAGTLGDYVEIGPDGAGASAFTRILTGLGAGGTFTVETQTRTGSGAGFAHAMTSAQVTFYR